MIPCELKYDKDGLLYLEDDNVFKRKSLHIDKRTGIDEYFQGFFYSLDSTDDYIIKYNSTEFTKKEIVAVKEMLKTLVEKQKNISRVDFPIGYLVHMKKLSGLIIKYYKDSISFYDIIKTRDFNYLGKYYSHDDNILHNLFLLYQDVLDIIYELLDNDICYTDINPGNVIITDNQIKLIDFDHKYVLFNQKDTILKDVMNNFSQFVKVTLRNYNFYYQVDTFFKHDEEKEYLKKLENTIRKGR